MIPTPFTNMAVSLSGGGYRATTFHLGALAYLDAKHFAGNNLLENVKIISTISGGTLTGVMYALKIAKGGSFQDCFDKLYELLSEDKLVDEALHKLNNPGKWTNKHKTRDLINSFAEVYNEMFYDKATFADLFDAPERHLSDAIFGSSEFTYGIQFRLQEEHDRGKFGNGYLNLPTAVAKEIRLADAAAASSCFPGGFEPLVMPHDFGNGPDSAVSKTWYDKGYQTTALVDGGVIDNQGIEGVKLAERRRSHDGDPYIGTYIVSDVSGEMMEPYQVPVLKHSNFKNFFTINRVNLILCVLAVVLCVLLYIGLPHWGIIASSSVLTLIGIWAIIFSFSRNMLRSAVKDAFGKSQLPEILQDLKVLQSTPIYILFYLVKFRATSVLKMVMDVFMKRIRRLQLDGLYSSPDWNYRFKSNYIYSLEKVSDLPDKMKKAVEATNNMPTTLWFTAKEKRNNVLDDLIACGQFTLCYNLIRYAKRIQGGSYKERVWDKLSKDNKDAILELQASMEVDWLKFKEDPYWLLAANKAKRQLKDESNK